MYRFRPFIVVCLIAAAFLASSTPLRAQDAGGSPQISESSSLHTDASLKAVAVQALLSDRTDWANRNTSLALPLGFTLGGIGTGLLGLGLAGPGATASDPVNSGLMAAGIAIGSVGFVATVVGVVLFATRTTKAEQRDHLRRIDEQLLRYGVRVSVAPWLSPVPRAASAGLNLHIAF